MKHKIYIGDNLNVMQIKKSELENSFDLIYIDPPYNTKYEKSYFDSKYDDDNWTFMIKPRLSIARELLKKSGVIFISIDDNQFANLKLICDDVFGKNNYVGLFITKQSQRSNAKHINVVHEYVLAYAKDKNHLPKFELLRINNENDRKMIFNIVQKVKQVFDSKGQKEALKKLNLLIKKYSEINQISWIKNYNQIDENGNVFYAMDLSTPSAPRSVKIYEINLNLEPLPTRGWTSDQRFIKLAKTNKLWFRGNRPYEKIYLKEAKDNVSSILNFYSRNGTQDLKDLNLTNLFDTPKPVDLIKYLINIYPQDDLNILDFFAGSGTTGQSVLELNKFNNKNHQLTLIQKDESINPKSLAYKKAVELNLKPKISEVLLHRLNVVMDKFDIDKNEISVEYFE